MPARRWRAQNEASGAADPSIRSTPRLYSRGRKPEYKPGASGKHSRPERNNSGLRIRKNCSDSPNRRQRRRHGLGNRCGIRAIQEAAGAGERPLRRGKDAIVEQQRKIAERHARLIPVKGRRRRADPDRRAALDLRDTRGGEAGETLLVTDARSLGRSGLRNGGRPIL